MWGEDGREGSRDPGGRDLPLGVAVAVALVIDYDVVNIFVAGLHS